MFERNVFFCLLIKVVPACPLLQQNTLNVLRILVSLTLPFYLKLPASLPSSVPSSLWKLLSPDGVPLFSSQALWYKARDQCTLLSPTSKLPRIAVSGAEL